MYVKRIHFYRYEKNFYLTLFLVSYKIYYFLDMNTKYLYSLSLINTISCRFSLTQAFPLVLRTKRGSDKNEEFKLSSFWIDFGIVEWIGLIIILWAILMMTSAILFLIYKFFKRTPGTNVYVNKILNFKYLPIIDI